MLIRRIGTAFLLVALACMVPACNDGGKARVSAGSAGKGGGRKAAKSRKAGLADKAVENSAPSVNSALPAPVSRVKGQGARIVVDTSGSMQGFVQRGSVVLETLHRTIDQTLSRHQANLPEKRCLLGETLDCTQTPDYVHLRAPGLYNAPQSRLDLALLRPRLPDGSNPALPQPEDNLDPYEINVLVTDGMQAGSAPDTTIEPDVPTAVEVACANGADPHCIGALLSARAGEGYGIWIIGLRLPFNGTHFAERGLDRSHWDRIVANVAEHNRQPEWVKFPFKASGFKTDKKGMSSFAFQGAKPLLIVILSREIERGRAFAGDLAESLRRERIAIPDAGQIFISELAPFGTTTHKIGSIKRAGGEEASSVVPGPLGQEKGVFTQPITCRGEGKATFDITVTTQKEGPELPVFAEDQFFLNRVAPLLDSSVMKPLERVGPNLFRTSLNCLRLRPGVSEARFEIVSRRTFQPEKAGGTWWADWSADNSYEWPDRVYGLKTLVNSVLRPVLTRRDVHGTLRVQIERQ